jgi:hypothetical protein
MTWSDATLFTPHLKMIRETTCTNDISYKHKIV